MLRSREARNNYAKYRKSQPAQACDFCNPDPAKVVQTKKYFYVLPNLFSYDLWDYKQVAEHLLLIPKRHVKSMTEFTRAERIELVDTMAEWEAKGYSVFARTDESSAKTVPHQHTHLIKTTGPFVKQIIYNEKPYVLWYR